MGCGTPCKPGRCQRQKTAPGEDSPQVSSRLFSSISSFRSLPRPPPVSSPASHHSGSPQVPPRRVPTRVPPSPGLLSSVPVFSPPPHVSLQHLLRSPPLPPPQDSSPASPPRFLALGHHPQPSPPHIVPLQSSGSSSRLKECCIHLSRLRTYCSKGIFGRSVRA